MKRSKLFVLAGLLITALAATFMLRSTSAAAAKPSASGHGTILLQDTEGRTVRRQFSFSARINSDGTVQGSAIIHNPSFDPKYDAQFNITCLQLSETAPASAAQSGKQATRFSTMSLMQPSSPFSTTANQATTTTRSAKSFSTTWSSQVPASSLVLTTSHRYQSNPAASRSGRSEPLLGSASVRIYAEGVR